MCIRTIETFSYIFGQKYYWRTRERGKFFYVYEILHKIWLNKLLINYLYISLFLAFQCISIYIFVYGQNLWVLFVHWIDKSLFHFKIYVWKFSLSFILYLLSKKRKRYFSNINPLFVTSSLVILSSFVLCTTTHYTNFIP